MVRCLTINCASRLGLGCITFWHIVDSWIKADLSQASSSISAISLIYENSKYITELISYLKINCELWRTLTDKYKFGEHELTHSLSLLTQTEQNRTRRNEQTNQTNKRDEIMEWRMDERTQSNPLNESVSVSHSVGLDHILF